MGGRKSKTFLEKASEASPYRSGHSVLKISDFGLARWHRDISNNGTDKDGLFVSKTYRAPEYDLTKPVSQPYDIWALACLYLEFITWYLCGWEEGVDEFSKQRASESPSFNREDSYAIKEDHFFNIAPKGSKAQYEASRKCRVIKVGTWIDKLHATQGCSEFIHDFLDLISEHMLRIRIEMRYECKDVAKELGAMYTKCKSDAFYHPPTPKIDSYDSLDDLLRDRLIEHQDGAHKNFLTLQCLLKLLSTTRVRRYLEQFLEDAKRSGYVPHQKDFNHYLRRVSSNDNDTESFIAATHGTHIRLFATLVLANKAADVFRFIDNKISDESLPIAQLNNNAPPCMKEWKRRRFLDDFGTWQWRMNVPFLSYGGHEIFDAQVILPFIEGSRHRDSRQDPNYLGTQTPYTEAGGYGEVSQVKIHPNCHDFHKIEALAHQLPSPEGPFALKKLLRPDSQKIEEEFRKERRMLDKFNGKVHPHIVSVLTSFKYGDRYHFLFPWAECDLGRYFERSPGPISGIQTARWISNQCLKIMEAVDLIHIPLGTDALPPEEKLFGRHGDIKAENILVFKSRGGEENLVLSDFGLCSMHHDWSKSIVSNQKIGATPGFRPPECDMSEGQISRSFDIWTLGCLFLDLLTWLLGGESLRTQFEEERTTPYINGRDTSIYFEIVAAEDKESNKAGYIVKEQWISMMHRHENCTQFVHEFLDLIEKRMLIVETNVRKRARTEELKESLKIFHDRCQSPNAEVYYLRPTPDPTPLGARTLTIAQGPLNKNARENISKFNITLRKVTGSVKIQQAELAHDEELSEISHNEST
ncbi:kinase-like protein [Hypomontagnella monticulosa]|nr:kinase-like protein [Hypomontagnella monticulosa]